MKTDSPSFPKCCDFSKRGSQEMLRKGFEFIPRLSLNGRRGGGEKPKPPSKPFSTTASAKCAPRGKRRATEGEFAAGGKPIGLPKGENALRCLKSREKGMPPFSHSSSKPRAGRLIRDLMPKPPQITPPPRHKSLHHSLKKERPATCIHSCAAATHDEPRVEPSHSL